jgi:hypothetical protein
MAWISVRCSDDSGADVLRSDGTLYLRVDGKGVFARGFSRSVVGQEVVGTKSRHHLFNVAGHRDSDRVGGKRDVHSKVGVASGLNGKLIVVRLKSLNQVISVVLSNVANAEIVDHKAEHNIARFVFQETGGVDALLVSVLLRVRDEA